MWLLNKVNEAVIIVTKCRKNVASFFNIFNLIFVQSLTTALPQSMYFKLVCYDIESRKHSDMQCLALSAWHDMTAVFLQEKVILYFFVSESTSDGCSVFVRCDYHLSLL